MDHIPSINTEWADRLRSYSPLMRPKEVEEASDGIVTAQMIYRRNCKDRDPLPLKVRVINGRPLVAKEDLLNWKIHDVSSRTFGREMSDRI